MSPSLIVPSRTDVPLRLSPIEPSWIIEGNPTARKFVLSRSFDGMALTIVWECTEGKFNWTYDCDETIYFLQGSVVIESDTMAPTRLGPGDVLFFRRGARACWTIEKKIRKLAFCRTAAPALLGLVIKTARKIVRGRLAFVRRERRQPAW